MRVLLTALAGAALIAAAPVPDPAERAAVAWLKQRGHPLSTGDPTAADLAPLVAKFNGARVIGVGEVTHGTHEDQAFKVALIKELVRAGAIDTLAIEANRFAGTGFDRYVRLGVGEPVALIEAPSFFRIWKGDEFAGLLIWLRAWNLAHGDKMVGVVGIDNQDGAVDAAFAQGVLERHDRSLATDLRRLFGTMLPPPGAPRLRPSDWIAARSANDIAPALSAAKALRDVFSAHPEWASDPDYAEASYAATVTWQNLDEFSLQFKGAGTTNMPAGYTSRRDRYMAANLLQRLGTRHRAALWAHDLHILSACPEEWQKEGYWTVGLELKKQLGSGYRTIGATYTHAEVLLTRRVIKSSADMAAPPNDEPTQLENSGPNGAGRVLAALPGDAWWFDLSDRDAPGAPTWLQRPMFLGDVGWAVDPATFQTSKPEDDAAPFGMGFNVIVWYRNMTPQRRWPVLPTPARP